VLLNRANDVSIDVMSRKAIDVVAKEVWIETWTCPNDHQVGAVCDGQPIRHDGSGARFPRPHDDDVARSKYRLCELAVELRRDELRIRKTDSEWLDVL
jgi:hypothetical protein